MAVFFGAFLCCPLAGKATQRLVLLRNLLHVVATYGRHATAAKIAGS